jgi:hypothetical protein
MSPLVLSTFTAFVTCVVYHLQGIFENLPKSYLFLCPIQRGPGPFGLPDVPAYWSLDPSGRERLTPLEAIELGFPSLDFTMTVWGQSWDEVFYAGLRTFHRGKGFDPDSQDIARHLGYPLYQLSGEPDTPLAHGEHSHRCRNAVNIQKVTVADDDEEAHLSVDGEENQSVAEEFGEQQNIWSTFS